MLLCMLGHSSIFMDRKGLVQETARRHEKVENMGPGSENWVVVSVKLKLSPHLFVSLFRWLKHLEHMSILNQFFVRVSG